MTFTFTTKQIDIILGAIDAVIEMEDQLLPRHRSEERLARYLQVKSSICEQCQEHENAID